MKRFGEFISSNLDKIPAFLRAMHCEENGTPSSRRMQMTAVVSSGLSYIGYDVILHGGLRSESIELSKFLAALVGAYVGITRIAEK